MKIIKFNEKKEDALFVRGAIREFKADVLEALDNFFVELKDVYFESKVDHTFNDNDIKTTYTISKSISIGNGFDGVAKSFKEAYDAYSEFEVTYQHILDTFNSGSLFEDYPMPTDIGYSLIKGANSNRDLSVGINIFIHYKY